MLRWPGRKVLLQLSVLKRCVPKTLAFAFGLRLRSKARCFKTRALGRSWRLPNGKPQERLRFRDLRSKTLAFKKRIAIVFFCDLKTSLGARACVQVLCVRKTRRFAFAFLSPLSPPNFPEIDEIFRISIGRKHPSRDVIFSGQKMPKNITSHDVREPLKQALSASRDVMISGQICGSKLQKVFSY